MTQITKNFSVSEMKCKCGCDRCDMDEVFMEKLQLLRDKVGPLKISSAFRCPAHNQAESSSGPNGPHTTGKAADIACSGEKARTVHGEAYILGFKGLGVSQKGAHGGRFIHIDDVDTQGDRPRPWEWSY